MVRPSDGTRYAPFIQLKETIDTTDDDGQRNYISTYELEVIAQRDQDNGKPPGVHQADDLASWNIGHWLVKPVAVPEPSAFWLVGLLASVASCGWIVRSRVVFAETLTEN